MRTVPAALALLLLAAAAALPACGRRTYFPDRAVAPYPDFEGPAAAVDIQVFRDKQHIEIVNATPRGYDDCTVWVNQRYARPLDRLGPGETVRLRLWDFYDERGEVPNAGGFWRTYEPTPVRLVELESDGTLVGLVTIVEETE